VGGVGVCGGAGVGVGVGDGVGVILTVRARFGLRFFPLLLVCP
jgi:hypothetical protein